MLLKYISCIRHLKKTIVILLCLILCFVKHFNNNILKKMSYTYLFYKAFYSDQLHTDISNIIMWLGFVGYLIDPYIYNNMII